MRRLLLIHPSRAFADTLGARLAAEPDIGAVDRADSLPDGIAHMVRRTFDAVILPASLAGSLFSLSADGTRWTGPPYVVVLAGNDDDEQAVDLIRSGASGWVDRRASTADLLQAVRGACTGQTIVPPDVLTRVIGALSVQPTLPGRREQMMRLLTPREQEVLTMIERGIDRRDIAARLHVSPNTVRTHVQSILQRFGVHSILAAVALVRDAQPIPSASAGVRGAGGG